MDLTQHTQERLNAQEASKKIKNIQAFTEPIEAVFSNDGKSITLIKGFYYRRKNSQEASIIVPSGFKSDGFTACGLIPRFGKGLKCALLHDFLCDYVNFKLPRSVLPPIMQDMTRKDADLIFLEAMQETKSFNTPKIYLIYTAVRAFAIFLQIKKVIWNAL